MGALLNFLGGAAFRAVWSGVSNYFDKRQEHKHEIQRTVLQGRLDAEAHARNLAGIKLQAEIGIKTVQVQAEAAIGEIEADAWRQAVSKATQPTGIKFVDIWNGSMRPAFYTLALFIILLICFKAGWQIAALEAAGIIDLVFSIVGFLFADRTIRNRSK